MGGGGGDTKIDQLLGTHTHTHTHTHRRRRGLHAKLWDTCKHTVHSKDAFETGGWGPIPPPPALWLWYERIVVHAAAHLVPPFRFLQVAADKGFQDPCNITLRESLHAPWSVCVCVCACVLCVCTPCSGHCCPQSSRLHNNCTRNGAANEECDGQQQHNLKPSTMCHVHKARLSGKGKILHAISQRRTPQKAAQSAGLQSTGRGIHEICSNSLLPPASYRTSLCEPL